MTGGQGHGIRRGTRGQSGRRQLGDPLPASLVLAGRWRPRMPVADVLAQRILAAGHMGAHIASVPGEWVMKRRGLL